MPQRGIDPGVVMLDPSDAFIQRSMVASGIFSVQQDFDAKYVLVPLRFMNDLSGNNKQISAFEIKLKNDDDSKKVMAQLQNILGNDFTVKDRLMQHDFLFKVIGAEKIAVYIILGFILMIAAFNLFGTLTMLILDKRDDLQTLYHMGADLKLAQRIFLLEGLAISVGGAFVGMTMGAILCGLQQYFGLVKIGGGEGFVVEAYPVDMQLGDFMIVMGIVMVIGWLAASYTSKNIVRRISDPRLATE
jgi:lipoprotein-releasing system permease protein